MHETQASARPRHGVTRGFLIAFAAFAVIAGALLIGRLTAPRVPATLDPVAQVGQRVADAEGWADWSYAGAVNGVSYYAGSPPSGDRCVVAVAHPAAPLGEAICTPPKTTDMVVQTTVQTAPSGVRIALTTSVRWVTDTVAQLDVSVQPPLDIQPAAVEGGTVQRLAQDRARVAHGAQWDGPPTLLDFSLATGTDVFRTEDDAVEASYWAATSSGARAVIAVLADSIVVGWLDSQQDPLHGPRATSFDFSADVMAQETELPATPAPWFWRVEWPVDGAPTLVPVPSS